ncbi:MAG: hypothetical protein ABFD92_21630 [Planctomycetaceae bacterium]
MKTTIHVLFDLKEVYDALIEAAKGQAGQGAGSASVAISFGSDGKPNGAVVEFSRGKV